MPDELDVRVRALEAERLRPVPAAPIHSRRDTTQAERDAARAERITAEERLIALAAALDDTEDHEGDE